VSDFLGRSVRGQMVIGGLGSCFFLLAMISLSIFWITKRELKDQPAIQERVITALLVPLAIGDVSGFLTAQ
jgi:Ca2+/Na+ antiporter